MFLKLIKNLEWCTGGVREKATRKWWVHLYKKHWLIKMTIAHHHQSFSWSYDLFLAGFKGNIQHSNNKCFHPYGGKTKPKPGTRLVLHPDCYLKRIEFEIIEKDSHITIKHVPSGKCLVPVLKKKFLGDTGRK